MNSVATQPIPILNNESIKRFLKLAIVQSFALVLAGCQLFDDDKDTIEEPPEVEVTIAPTADFSASIVSGTAPLEVTFTDTSVDGSATISQWQWDFGDSNSSTEQNPVHTYDNEGTYSVTLTVTSSDGTDTETKADFITVDAPPVQLSLAVVDINGVLLDDVQIESTDFDIFQQTAVETGLDLVIMPTESDGVIAISKSGYLTNYLFMEGMGVDQTMNVVLKERSEPIVFNGFRGGEFYGADGVGVEIPGESLLRADGSVVTGDVELFITPIDISDELELGAFPGSYYGTTAVGEPQDSLFSYGVFDITFEENGEELQLADDTVALLTLPLYATKSFENEDLVDGDTIPLWYLDVVTGLWIHESDGQVVDNPLSPNGLALQATTTHFTAFNTDMNPPGLGRGAGGGGGGSLESHICRMSIDLVGAEEGVKYQYTIVYSRPGWPASKRSRIFEYTGAQLTQNILAGFAVTVTVSKGPLEGSSSFICNGSDITTEITLGDQPPVITDFNIRVEPVFGRDADNMTIVEQNRLYVGGYWVNASLGLIDGLILPSPLILQRGSYRDVAYTADDPSPLVFSLTVSNEFGEETTPTSVTYIDEHPPILGYSYAVYDVDLNQTMIVWGNVQGVDTIDIYQLDDLGQSLGIKILPTINVTSGTGTASFPGEISGYLRFDYSNRYGTSSDFIQVGGAECPPFSDACLEAN